MSKHKNINVGNFNLLNLVNPDITYYGRRRYSQRSFKQKCEWIGSQLDRMKGDIVGFQEIFHEDAFEKVLQHSKHLSGANFVVGNPTGELPRVGLATKYEILEHEVIEDFPSLMNIEGAEIPIAKFSRPVLRAKVRINPTLVITVFVVHLKSKRPALISGENRSNPVDLARGQARSLIRRAVEATALREVLMKDLLNRNQPVIVLGDVNDSGLAVTSRIVSGEPPHRNYPKEVKTAIWDVLLYHARDIQARKSYHDYYYSHIHNGHHEALDHIMVSQELVAENPNHVAKIGYVTVLNDHLIDETLSDERVQDWESDHGQVVATIELR